MADHTFNPLDKDQYQDLIHAFAHAIRNPLTGVSMNVQYLQMVYSQHQAQSEIYADIMESVARLDQMIREFVEFTGSLKLKFEPVDLNTLLSRAVADHDALLQSRRLKVTTHLNGVPEVEADLNHFSRAMTGLVEHCAHCAEEGGRLSVTSHLVDQTAILEFIRSGQPLTPARVEQLFDPLTALQSSESGFGMAFVHKILTAHHCRLEIDSRSGEDTRYKVLFPLGINAAM
jgi:signal transduction histidine kinase